VTQAFGYAVVAAVANVLGAWAVARGAASNYRLIEPFVAFSAGFMLALVLTEILPEAFARSGGVAPLRVFLGYLAVHATQHTVTPHFHFGEETHAVSPLAARSAVVGLLLHTFFDGVAIASAFLVDPALGVAVFVAVFLHKLPEGASIASLILAAGGSRRRALLGAGALGLASLLGVALTDQVQFLVLHGLALSGGVTLYVAASNLVPEFQGKRGWATPLAFFAGAVVFFLLHVLLAPVA
jgi:ZIP family zinc transporter/zinc and cadmium transporter